MNLLLSGFFYFWALYFVWIHSIGTIHNSLFNGLSFFSVILFDLFALSSFIFLRKKKLIFEKKMQFRELYSQLYEFPKILSFLLFLVVLSILFTSIFQIPTDWDGMDYHLPPIIESWKNGFWARSIEPYFAARHYPKTQSLLALWWIQHFGLLFGLRGVLLMPALQWIVGCICIRNLFPKNPWAIALWISYPLIAREATTYYVDSAGLITFLATLTFAKEKKWLLTAIALGLHSSLKFTNLPTSVVLFLCIIIWNFRSNISNHFKKILLLAIFPITFGAYQPVLNIFHEGKPFGVLKCEILGKDFCNGDLSPTDLVHAPIIPDYDKEDSWIKKILTGFTPNKWIPTQDVNTGGFGWVWIIGILFSLSLNKFNYKKLLFNEQGTILVISLLADLTIGALWYCRFHTLFGFVLIFFSALVFYETIKIKNKIFYAIVVFTISMQCLWIIPQRQWFLGIQNYSQFSYLFENIGSILKFGFPKYATHEADKRSLEFYKFKNKIITICGKDFRPALSAYGADLTNDVRWFKSEVNESEFEYQYLKNCPFQNQNQFQIINKTKIWIENK